MTDSGNTQRSAEETDLARLTVQEYVTQRRDFWKARGIVHAAAVLNDVLAFMEMKNEK